MPPAPCSSAGHSWPSWVCAASSQRHPDRVDALVARRSGRWARWRWLVAAAAGVLGVALTGWPVVGLIVAAAVVGLPFLLGSAAAASRAIDRVQAIEEWTRRLADVLATGVGLDQGLLASASTCPPVIAGEVELSGGTAVRAVADRARVCGPSPTTSTTPSGDFVVATLLLASRRRGPGLSSVLTAAAGSVADEVAARRKIEAERAKPRSTARLVTLITLGVAALLMLNGTYLAPYGDGLGQLVLLAIAGAFTGCLLWIRSLTLATPTPRFLTTTDGAP